MGEAFSTNIGVPQGNFLSPILFIVYLVEALNLLKSVAVPPHLADHGYNRSTTNLLVIDEQYADDTSWITNNENIKTGLRQEAPSIVKQNNL